MSDVKTGEEFIAILKKIMAPPETIAVAERVVKELREAQRLTAQHGLERIARERQRQAELWSSDHDDEHESGELAQAAICYADEALPNDWENKTTWPFGHEAWKPSDDPIRNLEKAGALIAAEIDRLERARSAEGRRP